MDKHCTLSFNLDDTLLAKTPENIGPVSRLSRSAAKELAGEQAETQIGFFFPVWVSSASEELWKRGDKQKAD